MIRKRNSRCKNEERVTDPHELILSLVDMGSLDSDEALLACVQEMSDAECKRVLSSLSLPEVDDEADDMDDEMSVEFPSDEDSGDWEDDEDGSSDEDLDDESEDEEDEGEEDEEDDEDVAELESRIRRLERNLSNESRRRFNRR